MSSKRNTGWRNWDQTDPTQLQTTPEIKKEKRKKTYYNVQEISPEVFEVINNYGDAWLITRQADGSLEVDERPQEHKNVDAFIIRAVQKEFG